jgi:hypothetical protein
MTSAYLFSGDRIRELLGEVAEQLGPEAPQETVIVVGGSLLAWRGLRASTQDVDSSRRISDEVRLAVRVVVGIFDETQSVRAPRCC